MVFWIRLKRQCFCLTRRGDQLQIILEPGDHSSCIIDISFQNIVHFSVQFPRKRSYHAFTVDWFLTDVHHNGGTCSVSGLDHSCLDTSLSEQCSMGVSKNTADRNRRIQITVKICYAILTVGICHFRKTGYRNSKQSADFRIPGKLSDIEHLGTGSIGIIGTEFSSFCQFIDKPAVNRSAAEFASVCLFLCSRYILENPGNLCR